MRRVARLPHARFLGAGLYSPPLLGLSVLGAGLLLGGCAQQPPPSAVVAPAALQAQATAPLHLNAVTPCVGSAARMKTVLAGTGLTLTDYFEPTTLGRPQVDQPWCLAVLDAPNLGVDAARQKLDAALAQGAGMYSLAVAEVGPGLGTDPGMPNFDASCRDLDALQSEAATAQPIPLADLPALLGGRADPQAGAAVTVAIIDGGVDGQPVLPGSRHFLGTEAANAAPGDVTDRFDCAQTAYKDGHGAAVAGIIHTLAPGAGLLALKACDDQGRCPTTSVAKALLYLRNRYPGLPEVRVVNMSFGGLPGSGDPVIAAILKNMSNVLPNTALLSAAGNVRDAAGHFPADLLREVNTLVPVAAAKRVNGTWALAGFNTWATWANKNILPLAAPGVRLTLRLGGVDRELTGSSFATPVAAAIAARFARPGDSGVELGVKLRRNAQKIGDFLMVQMR